MKDSVMWNRNFLAAKPNGQEGKDEGYNARKAIILDTATKEEMCEMDLNQAMNPAENTFHYNCAKWSPIEMDIHGRCILAVLTLDHRLFIFVQERKKWIQINLVEQFQEADKIKQVEQHYKGMTEFDKFRHHCNLTAVKDFCWSHLYQNVESSHKWSYLFHINKNGNIVIWKIEAPFLSSEQVTLMDLIETEATFPSYMQWGKLSQYTGILIFGDIEGTTRLYQFKLTDGNLQCFDKQYLWKDTDKIIPGNFNWNQQHHLLLYSKGPYLIGHKLTVSDDQMIDFTTFNFSFDGAHPIVDIAIKVGGTVAVAFLNGRVEVLKIDKETGHPTDKQILPMLNEESVTYTNNGLAYSRNGAVLAIAQSPAGTYDHLVLKCPMKIEFHHNMDLNDVCKVLLGKTNFVDCLDYLAILKEGIRQELPLAAVLESHLSNQESWFHHNNAMMYKLLRYITVLRKSMKKKDDVTEDELKNIQILSFLLMKAYYKDLLSQHPLPNEPSKEESLVHCMLTFVAGCDSPDFQSSSAEPCVICSDPIKFTCLESGVCSSGHSYGRCCQTMLLCMAPNYRRCNTCTALAQCFHSDSHWIRSVQTSRCTLCEGLLM